MLEHLTDLDGRVMVGSHPTLPGELDPMVLASVAFVVAGVVLVLVVERLGRRHGATA